MKKLLLIFSIFLLTSCSKVDYKEITNEISLNKMSAIISINASFTSQMVSQPREERSGSGVVFYENNDYYFIITNSHITMNDVGYSATYQISNYKNDETYAKLIHHDETYDLSVLSVDKTIELSTIDISTKENKSNDVVIALGSPNDQQNTITYGEYLSLISPPTISNDPMYYNPFSKIDFDVIKHDAYITSGSSGGPLLNTSLEIIGINYAVVESNGFECSYSVPANKIIEFLSNELFADYFLFN